MCLQKSPGRGRVFIPGPWTIARGHLVLRILGPMPETSLAKGQLVHHIDASLAVHTLSV